VDFFFSCQIIGTQLDLEGNFLRISIDGTIQDTKHLTGRAILVSGYHEISVELQTHGESYFAEVTAESPPNFENLAKLSQRISHSMMNRIPFSS
jgi:hypothetical protein